MGMRFGKHLFAALAFCLFTAVSLAAQEAGTVSGRLTDVETGLPVVAVTVQVVSASGRVIASGVTDAEGNFRIANVPVGTYALVLTHVGYQTLRLPDIRVVAGETTMAGGSMTSSAFLLNPVVVSASKRQEKAIDAPASVSVVSKEEIEQRPAVTPIDHIRTVPGVDVITSGVQSTNVVVRGFNNVFSGKLHALTDYRIAGVPSLRVNFLHFIPQNNDDIDRIEVVLGPGSALYGPNTANGVLHILTKSPLLDEPSTSLSLAGGMHSGAPLPPGTRINVPAEPEQGLFQATLRTSQRLSEKFGFKVSGQYLKADEFLYRDTVEDNTKLNLPTDPTALQASPLFAPGMPLAERQLRAARIANRDFDIERWSGDVRADWRASDNFTAVLSGGITNDNSIELTGIGAGQAVDWKYSYVQARANFRNWFVQTYLNMSDAGDTFLLRNGAPITDKSKVWAGQLQHQASIGTWQTFTYGGDYVRTMPETEGTINGANEDDDEYDELGAYLQSQTALHRMLDLVLAGRYDKHSALPDPVWSPRAGLVFKPAENHTLRATYNRAFSTPTSLDLFLDIDAGGLGALGPLGFRAHAQAPGRRGINLHATDGSLQIRTPFAGNPADPVANRTLRPISLAGIYTLQVEAIRRASALVAQNPALVQALLAFRADPTFNSALSLILLDPLTTKALPFSNNAVSDVAGIEESTTSTFEVGYKGILGDRLLLAADVWFSKHKNFTSPLIAATPLVQVNPQQLVPFLVTRLTPVVGAANAQAIAQGMARLPGGVISSEQANTIGADMIVTYRNFGEVDLSGIDVAATALLGEFFQLGVTGSLVSDDFFRLPIGEAQRDTQLVALNAPKKKASANLAYRNVARGLNGEVRVRWTDEFPANSAGYVGLNCVDSTLQGDCVQSYTLMDLSAGYRLPFGGASLQLAITNLFDEEYQSFIGTPPIKRMAILRLRYDF
jgi:outer membrane receptor for ferrienterochelin and colicins